MLSYDISTNGKQKGRHTYGENYRRKSQSKTSEIRKEEQMEQGGSSTVTVFCDVFFSCQELLLQ